MTSEQRSPFASAVEVSAGVIFRRGQLLITQRQAESHLGGFWEFPGGKREPAETFEECLHRELREELGIEVVILGLLERITHHYPGKTVQLHFFHCRWRQHEPQTLGCPAFSWIGPMDLSRYCFPPADARLLETLQSNPSLWTA